MTGSRLRAAPFLCPSLPPPRHSLQTPPHQSPFLPAGSHPHGASRTGLTRPPPRWHPFPRRGPNPVAPPAPASPSPHLSETPPSRRGPVTLSAPTSPSPHLASAPSSWWGILPEAPHAPAPSTSPLYYLFLPTGLLPKVPPTPPALFLRGSFPLAGPRPQVPPAPVSPSPRLTTPSSRRDPIPTTPPAPAPPVSTFPPPHLPGEGLSPKHHPPPSNPTSPTPPPPGGEHPKKFFPHRAPLSAFPAVKNRLGGRLSAPPGRTRAFLGSFRVFRVLFGLFRVFFEKSWAKNFPFSPGSGIMKPLTGTARR